MKTCPNTFKLHCVVFCSLHLIILCDIIQFSAVVRMNLFASTCCPLACTSDILRSLMIASLGSLVPSLPLGLSHSSARYAPYPCLWSYPRNSSLRGICNALAQGSLYIKWFRWRWNTNQTALRLWERPGTVLSDSRHLKSHRLVSRKILMESIGGRQRVEYRHKEIITM